MTAGGLDHHRRPELGIIAVPDLLRAAVEWLPIGVLIVNADSVIVVANREIERVFGYTSAELTGESVDVLVPDASRAAHAGLRHDYLPAPAAPDHGGRARGVRTPQGWLRSRGRSPSDADGLWRHAIRPGLGHRCVRSQPHPAKRARGAGRAAAVRGARRRSRGRIRQSPTRRRRSDHRGSAGSRGADPRPRPQRALPARGRERRLRPHASMDAPRLAIAVAARRGDGTIALASDADPRRRAGQLRDARRGPRRDRPRQPHAALGPSRALRCR